MQGFVSYVIGIRSVLKGDFKPQRMTRFLILVMSLLMGATIIVGGNLDAIGILIAQTFGSLVLFVLSIKKGVGGYEKLDIVTLVFVVSVLVIWYLTNDPYLALYLTILADIIAFIPTVIKIIKEPQTENWMFYSSDVIAAIFGILALEAYTLDKLAYPLYIFLINVFASLLIIFYEKRIERMI